MKAMEGKMITRNLKDGMKIEKWCKKVIDGAGGMKEMEKYELVVYHVPMRIAVAHWIIRCLANPDCEGSQDVLDAIMEQRKEVLIKK